MVIFLYNLYIFIWILHGHFTNIGFAFENNSVIKRLGFNNKTRFRSQHFQQWKYKAHKKEFQDKYQHIVKTDN